MNTLVEYKQLLVGYLPELLIEKAYESIRYNDAAHNVDHIYSVCSNGLDLVKDDKDHAFKQMVLAGCLLHDLGCRYDRDTHHVISYHLTFNYLKDYAWNDFDIKQTAIVALACLEHRASNKNRLSGVVSEYVALADRGKPDLALMVKRCALFRLEKGMADKQMLKTEIFNHLEDKVGSIGYMWKSFPKLGFEKYAKEIFDIKQIVDKGKPLTDFIEKELKMILKDYPNVK